MVFNLALEKRGQIWRFLSQSRTGLFSEAQPVVPVADRILYPL